MSQFDYNCSLSLYPPKTPLCLRECVRSVCSVWRWVRGTPSRQRSTMGQSCNAPSVACYLVQHTVSDWGPPTRPGWEIHMHMHGRSTTSNKKQKTHQLVIHQPRPHAPQKMLSWWNISSYHASQQVSFSKCINFNFTLDQHEILCLMALRAMKSTQHMEYKNCGTSSYDSASNGFCSS